MLKLRTWVIVLVYAIGGANAAEGPGLKDQSRMIMTPPAQTLQVIPVPQGYVRDGYRYRGSAGDVPFFMDREWFYEGTIQGSA